MRRRFKQPVDDSDEPGRAGDRARDVGPVRVAHHPALRDQPRHEHECGQCNGNVDQEDPAPGGEVHQGAADDRPGRAAEPSDAAPEAECLHPLARVREEQRDETERRRCSQRFAGTLQETRGDQHLGVNRGAACGRRDREQADAQKEQPPAPEDVCHPATQQKQSAGHQHIAVDDPGETGPAEAEVLLHAWQRDVHDGDVEDEHELDQGEYTERLPSPRVGFELR